MISYQSLCGALPSRKGTTKAYRKLRSFRAGAVVGAPADHVVSNALTLRLRNQGSGYCVGEGIGRDIAQQAPQYDPSGASIWREAHRQQGRIEDIYSGTRIEYGIRAIEDRGYSDPWRPGEDSDPREWGLDATAAGDDLADELAAYDTAADRIEHETIWGFGDAMYSCLQSAMLEHDCGIVIATGLREAFFDLGPDQVATLDHIGGDLNGHCMGIYGWRTEANGKLSFLLANSWGPHWGGATVNGVMRPGLFWCSSEAVNVFWECHRLRVVR